MYMYLCLCIFCVCICTCICIFCITTYTMLYPWWGCQINWKPQTIQSSNIQSTCICNKYTYICRTTQKHTITTQPQYRTYTSPYIPNAHSTVAILVQSFLRSIVGPPSCRRSTVDPPGCRLSHSRFAQFAPVAPPRAPLRHGEGGP